MRRLIAAVTVAAGMAAPALVAAPAHAYEVHISITGAGQITELTSANLVGSSCVTSSNNPTGTVGVNCYPGDPNGDYGWGWTVSLKATAKPGYRFVRWQSDGSPKPVICDGAGGSSTYTGDTCTFQTFDNLQTRAVFEDVTAPAMASLSGPSAPVNGATAFTFSAAPDPTFLGFECRVANVHDWLSCTSGRTENPASSGSYTFEVRAVDTSGNRSAISAWNWTVDKVAPTTTLTSGPSGPFPSTSATFGFTSNEPGTFRCSLDGAAFAACSSPRSYAGLAQGSHTFAVAAIDMAGNADPTPATTTWNVDTVPPETTLTSGPEGTTDSTSASFTFTSEPGAQFNCRLDNGVIDTACTSPATYDGLSLGQHTFRVWARDALGNTDASPVLRTWTIVAPSDTEPPKTTLMGGPSGAVSSDSAVFTFTSDEAGQFYCALDGAPPALCASPTTYSDLGEGAHTFTVYAVDGAGNVDPDPPTRTWTVDTVAPDTAITSGPAAQVQDTVAVFTLAAEPGASFRCGMDDAPATDCTSPAAYAGLSVGQHTLRVWARDAAGNEDPTPAVHTWTILSPNVVADTPPPSTTTPPPSVVPDTIIKSGPRARTSDRTPTFKFTTTVPGSTYQCKVDRGRYRPCRARHTLRRLKLGKHTLLVRASYGGVTDPTPARRRFKVVGR